MDIIQFLFAIVGSNTPITTAQRQDLENEAEQWRKSLGPVPDQPKNLKERLIWLERQWWARLALGIFYIPINKRLKVGQMEELDDPFASEEL